VRAIRSAALSGCVLLALALVIVGAASATGAPGKPAAGGDNTKARQAAEASCKAKGLKPGTDAFKACVKLKLAPAKPSGGDDPKARAAAQACQAQGLVAGTDAFKQCVRTALGGDSGGSAQPAPAPKPTVPAPNPDQEKAQQAAQACKAQGLQPDTDAFKQCVRAALGGDSGGSTPPAPAPKPPAPAPPAPNPDRAKAQQAAQACKAQGLQPDTDAFKQCVHKALGQ
jgi:hypothetical protein